MPAAIPIIVTVIAAAAEVSPLVMAVMVGAATIVATLLTPKPKSESADLTGSKVNTRSTMDPLPIPYGRCKVYGNEVFIEATGGGNEYLWIVQTLGEGPCSGVHQVSGVNQVYLGDKIYTSYGSSASYWFHSGTDDQTVDSSLHSAIAKWTDTMRGTCYAVFRLLYDLDKFQSLPTRYVILNGRLLYDPRTETTAWSNNAALVLYDYLTNQRYGRRWPSTILNTESVEDAANYCDAKGWTFNGLVTEWDSQDVVEDILMHFRGGLIWSEGQYYFRFFDTDYESSVFTIEDEHIYQGADNKAQLTISQPSRWSKPDQVSCVFIDPDKKYSVDYLIVPASGEGGVVEEISLTGYLDKEAVGAMGTYLLERALLDRVISGLFREELWQLEPFDLVTFSCSAFSIESQLLRVQEVSPDTDGVALSFVYETEDLYDDEYNLALEDVYECNLPDPGDTPGSIQNVVVTEVLADWRLRSETNLQIEFDPPDNPYYDRVEVYRSFDDVEYEFLFYSASSFTINNIEEGTTIYLRIKVVTVFGVKQTDNNDYKIVHTIQGASIVVPSSLAALKLVLTGPNSINLHAEQLFEADIDQYEFRLGSSWSGSLFLVASKAPNYSLMGLKPGSHIFWVSTKSSNLLYGSTPRSASVTVADPIPGWVLDTTETDDYTYGTHDNTEQVEYDSEYYLKCSHTGDVLVGTYTTPLIDLGAVDTFLFYVLADIVVTGQGTDWASIAPSPTTWAQMGEDQKWTDIMELPSGPNIKMTLNYGETTGLGNTVERMEVLSAIVTGRYFQVVITITDPTLTVFALVQNLTMKWCTS